MSSLVTSTESLCKSSVCVPTSSLTCPLPEFEICPAPLDIPINTFLPFQYFVLPDGLVFVDRKIPAKFDKPFTYSENLDFPMQYFVDLHEKVSRFGTYNFAGARIKLDHCKIKVDKFQQKILECYNILNLVFL